MQQMTASESKWIEYICLLEVLVFFLRISREIQHQLIHGKIYCKFSTETIRDLMRERKKKGFLWTVQSAYSNLIAGEAFVFVWNLKYHENQSTDKYTWRRDAHARGSFYRSDISLKKQPVIKIYISLSLCSKTNIKRIHNLSIENSRVF